MVGNARTRAALVLGAFLAIGFALLIGEGACRLVEARAASTGASIAVDDRWTGWRMRPGYEGPGPDLPSIHGLSYSVRVNLLGFRGADVPVSKARGVVRIVALGDSVTFGFGVEENETYLALVAAALSSIAAPVRIESINAAVPGYTSLQGLRSLDRVLALRPDVVTILFGWNDGWLTIEPYAVRTAAARTIVQSSALLTALTSWKEAKATSSTAVRSFHYVPPDDFEANLGASRANFARLAPYPCC